MKLNHLQNGGYHPHITLDITLKTPSVYGDITLYHPISFLYLKRKDKIKSKGKNIINIIKKAPLENRVLRVISLFFNGLFFGRG